MHTFELCLNLRVIDPTRASGILGRMLQVEIRERRSKPVDDLSLWFDVNRRPSYFSANDQIRADPASRPGASE